MSHAGAFKKKTFDNTSGTSITTDLLELDCIFSSSYTGAIEDTIIF